LKSRMLADPLHLLDASPITDGAAAVLWANETAARKAKKEPVWLKGVGHMSDAYHLGDRDLARSPALIGAAQKAYAMAGIADPLKQLDVAEVSDVFSYMELMWYEGLGFCPEGGGGRLIDSGATEMGGDLPVNPSGGCLSANPVLVAGLARLIECVLQVRGEADARPVQGCSTALAHCVMVIGK
jgi:acetyl-CoA C-acetyltransferase